MCNDNTCEWFNGLCSYKAIGCCHSNNTECENNKDVKESLKMSLLSKVLENLSMKVLAEEVYNRVEDDIAEGIAYEIDEEVVADMLVDAYRSDMVEIFVDKGVDLVLESMDIDSITEDMKEHVRSVLEDELQ